MLLQTQISIFLSFSRPHCSFGDNVCVCVCVLCSCLRLSQSQTRNRAHCFSGWHWCDCSLAGLTGASCHLTPAMCVGVCPCVPMFVSCSLEEIKERLWIFTASGPWGLSSACLPVCPPASLITCLSVCWPMMLSSLRCRGAVMTFRKWDHQSSSFGE